MRSIQQAIAKTRAAKSCRFCGIDYEPPDLLGPAAILVDCKRCKGKGGPCRHCPPKPTPGEPTGRALHFKASGSGCGQVHVAECPCFRCVPREVPPPSAMQTCGARECVDAWRRTLGSGKPPEGPTPEELREQRLERAGVPDEFWTPFNREEMNSGFPVRITMRRRVNGSPVELEGDLMDHAIFADHPHVYIWGPYQLGKTRLAVDVLDRALAGREVSTAAWTTPGILATKLAGQKLGTICDLEKKCSEARLTVIDDLFNVGTGHRSREALDCVERILQYRWDTAQPTITTSTARPVPRPGEESQAEKSLSERMGWYYERMQQGIQVAVEAL